MANDFTRFAAVAAKLAREHGPRLAAQVVNSPPVRAGREAITQAVTQTVNQALGLEAPAEPKEFTPGRPVTRTFTPTALMARGVFYAPQLDGQADPGEIVWTWVEFEETTGPNAGQGKDRPVLVVGRSVNSLLGLMLSGQERHMGDPDWVGIGSGPWDADQRPSWVRLDRVLDVPEDGIRREGAVLDRRRFESVAQRLRDDYGWS
ncbi:type II toxin-antitoxin system PemK/MazF family toxin [Tsukamurella tyrosinosolvens]|uniref:type II toxin-antitoxin system PemK/MazF family toxin n=1 Tax=Tsukamurella tyrosinosolvens TaxID=57704 RepID=UPI001CE0F33D|nr:type II toxin-antitoxin system PemK/MazF family toxin [Tsukamurella tyrosinosolvens]MCA4995525.1 type II toxin-antitoxin system PemK/MazF family toxin [Tsukamurella tyrosinosolvens]